MGFGRNDVSLVEELNRVGLKLAGGCCDDIGDRKQDDLDQLSSNRLSLSTLVLKHQSANLGNGATHVLRAGSLQLDRTVEQRIQDGENALALESVL